MGRAFHAQNHRDRGADTGPLWGSGKRLFPQCSWSMVKNSGSFRQITTDLESMEFVGMFRNLQLPRGSLRYHEPLLKIFLKK